jgi:hypothetical protein
MKRIILLLSTLLLLAGCAVGGVDVEQEQASGLAGELLDGHTFGQTFTVQSDGLHRIDLYTATYARENTHTVVLRVKAALDAAEDLVRLELPAAQISNSGPTVITFAPLAETAGQTLYFSVESPGSVPGDAITIYHHADNVYPDGQMFVDGQPAGGDIAFVAYTQEIFTLGDIWDDFYSRASQDRAFFVFYCSLLALLLVALALTLAWPRRKRPEADDQGQGKEGQEATNQLTAPVKSPVEDER